MCSLYKELLVEAGNSDDYSDGRSKEITFYDDDFEREILNILLQRLPAITLFHSEQY